MKTKQKTKLILTLSLFVIVFLSGFLGYLFGHRNLVIGENYIPKLINVKLNSKSDIDFTLFNDAYEKLKADYVGQIDPQKFLYGAISGAYSSLGDPYTVFFNPESSTSFQNELAGELEGIGIRIGILDQIPAVISPLPNSPAFKAGLKPRDKILKVDNTDTSTLTLDEVVNLIRGKEGTEVQITVLREGENETRIFNIVRKKLNVNTVDVSYQDDAAIILLSEFGVNTKKEFDKAANEIAGKGINKVVLDLRNNPGGLLDGAIDVSSDLFPNGTTVVIEDSKQGKQELKTSQDGILKNAKLIVLVNQGSASAAEIVAGAIKDHQRGKIIGEKTFGKGTVQQLEPLSGGSSVKITVAKWLTPNGSNIDKNGIEPDISLKEAEDSLFSKDDPLLKRALSSF